MNVCVLVAAERGLRCLAALYDVLEKEDNVTVFTFPEEPWEPIFVDDIINLAQRNQSNFFVTKKVHSEEFKVYWNSHIDIIFVVGWRYLIPKSIYSSAKIGCFVFHDSFLPEYRGFGPTVWAVRNGESHTGTSLFKISEKVDEGPILFQKKIPIGRDEYIGEIVERITCENEYLIKKAFLAAKDGVLSFMDQNHLKATYTCKNIPDDFQVDWRRSAGEIYNLIRAYSKPYPGAFSFLRGKKVSFWNVEIDSDTKSYIGFIPGRVKSVYPDGTFSVFCGDGSSLKIKNISVMNLITGSPSELIKSVGDTFEYKNIF